MTDLVYLAIIWAGVYCSSYLAEKTKLTSVLYFLAFGAVMVNVGLLPEQPGNFLLVFAEIGIILIMFALGFEESADTFVSSIRRTWGIALFGALAPFSAAWLLTMYFWNDYNIALICGVAMTATAVSLTMVSLKSEGLSNTAAATGIMTSAVLDDIASLALLAVVIPLVTEGGDLSIVIVMTTLLKAASFFLLITFFARVLFPHDLEDSFIRKIPFLGRWGIRDFLLINNGEKATLALLLTALVISLIGHQFGFHPAVGAYMAGLILREEYFHNDSSEVNNLFEETKKIIDDVAFSWIGPVFFVVLGTNLILEVDIFLSVIDEALILFFCIVVAQVLSASLAARYTGNFMKAESILIGLGMLGRAELAFVVLNIAYIQNPILSKEAFYTLMFTIFFLNVTVPLSIRWYKPYYDAEMEMARKESIAQEKD